MRRDPLLTLGLTGPGDVPVHRVLRALAPEDRHVFEPLHPRLVEFHHALEQHPDAWPEGTDEPDRRELQTPFLSRDDPAEIGFRPRFGRGGFFRSALGQEPDLGAYLRRLVNRDENPVHLHLTRALGRTGLLAELFREARAILLVRPPLLTWAAWKESAANRGAGVNPLQRRLYELEVQLSPDEHRAWGFEAARDHPPFARFLVMWGFLHRLALREARRFGELDVLEYGTLLEDPEPTLARLAPAGPRAGRRISKALAALEGAPAPRPPGSEREIHRRRAFLGELPETSPLPDVLESFGYRP